MEKHNDLEEIVQNFHCHLDRISIIDDLFPPEDGVRELRKPLPPTLPSDTALCLGAISELCVKRQHRQLVVEGAGKFLIESYKLVSA